MILTNPVNGNILTVDDNLQTQLNFVYRAEQLYYKAPSSSKDIFTYQGIDNESQPPKKWTSEICTQTIIVCYESCNKCTEKGDKTTHNCDECDTMNGF